MHKIRDINQVRLVVREQSRLITAVQEKLMGEEVATEDLNQQPRLLPFRRVDEFNERGLFEVTNPSLLQLILSSKRSHPQNYVPMRRASTNTHNICIRYSHAHTYTPHPTWLCRNSTAPPTPPSISPVWKHFKQTCTLLCYKKGKLQDMLSSIPAGLIRIVLNSHCHAF